MERSSKVLLDLESKYPSSTSIESSLLVCKSNELLRSQATEPKPLNAKPTTSSLPKSQVLGKVKDFLGVLSEANNRLQLDAKDNSKDYDIEVLTGNESEYIEMDLMLGVADLHTPEAVAAAESAIVGYQPVIPLAASSSESASEDSSSDDDEDDEDDDSDDNDENGDSNIPCSERSTTVEHGSLKKNASRNGSSKKKAKIVELS